MIFYEKSKVLPRTLKVEKEKKHGSYRCEDVLLALAKDFRNKCYLCEVSEMSGDVVVEHLVAHKEDKELKFAWSNLFLACGHCNNTKARYEGRGKPKYEILNCTKPTDRVELSIRYELIVKNGRPQIRLVPLNNSSKLKKTLLLLEDIHNGTTPKKKLESHWLRNKISRELNTFQMNLNSYKANNNSSSESLLIEHLTDQSPFAAFKRWIMRKSGDPCLLAFLETLGIEC